MASTLLQYIGKRLLLIFPMVFIIIVFTFIFSQLMVGDPTMNLFPIGTPMETIENWKQQWGLNEPWYVQLKLYLVNFFKGDLGTSAVVAPGMEVKEYLKLILPRTIELVIVPVLLIPIIGVKLGVLSAQKKDTRTDILIRGGAVLGVAIPVFWLAMLLQYFFGVILPNFTAGKYILPTFGFKSIGYPNPPRISGFRLIDCLLANDQQLLIDTLSHLVIPILCQVMISFASITRQTRSSMLDVLQQDYIRTARAKGCQEQKVIYKHALRNALLPTSNEIVGVIVMSFAGSFMVEKTFNYNGLGLAMVNAINSRDYWMINGVILIFSLLVLFGTLIADIVYVIIDPRIKYR